VICRASPARSRRRWGVPWRIAIPALGEPVICPAGALGDAAAAAIAAQAVAIGEGQPVATPDPIVEAVTVRIGDQIVGIVVAAARAGDAPPQRAPAPERHAWLEAAAAAASVTALLREADAAGTQSSGEVLLAELAAGPVEDLPGFLVRARRLGLDLSAGASAISARTPAAIPATATVARHRPTGTGCSTSCGPARAP